MFVRNIANHDVDLDNGQFVPAGRRAEAEESDRLRDLIAAGLLEEADAPTDAPSSAGADPGDHTQAESTEPRDAGDDAADADRDALRAQWSGKTGTQAATTSASPKGGTKSQES